MKKVTIAALLAGQLTVAARPVMAAELTDERAPQMGAFAGVRLRMALDGETDQRRLRAGLALAPTMQSRGADGEIRTRIGDGLELGFNGDERVRLSLAGTPVSRLAQGEAGPDGRRAGVSTLGWVAIGVGGVLVTGFALWSLCLSGEICDMNED